jgi:hypothetical protein
VGQDRLKIFGIIGAQAIATIWLVRVRLPVSSVIGFVPTPPAHAIGPPQDVAVGSAEVHAVIFLADGVKISTCASRCRHGVKALVADDNVGGIYVAGSVDSVKPVQARTQRAVICPKRS